MKTMLDSSSYLTRSIKFARSALIVARAVTPGVVLATKAGENGAVPMPYEELVMKRFSCLLALLIALVGIAPAQAQTVNPGVKLPKDIEAQKDPLLNKEYLRKRFERVPLPPIARARSAYLTVYAVPVETWCRNHPDGDSEGRVWVQMRYPVPASGSPLLAELVVHVGSLRLRSNVSLGAGDFSIASPSIPIPAREFCTDSCVDYHLEARNRADAAKVDRRTRQACIRPGL